MGKAKHHGWLNWRSDMKIKRTSWHYRIIDFWADCGRGERRGDNLCIYFWRFMNGLFFSFISLGFIGVIVGAISYLMHSYFTSPFFMSITVMIVFLLSSIIFPMLAILYFRKKVGIIEIPKSNLLFAYLKAKKEKVCPLIEYHD